MKFSLSWLKQILGSKKSADEIATILNSIGIEVDALHPKDSDVIFEVALTPNLSYAANILGIAREISAITEEKVTPPSFSLKAEGQDAKALFKVRVEEKEACPRYMARVVTDVKVGPSPDWLVQRLESAGMRSLNNVVDITNYVLLECGHPLHAFDLDKLEGKEIVVRYGKKGEKIVTLDGKEHFPTDETLLICDAKRPVAVAGVMGSEETEVKDHTQNVLLEAAYFEPTQVRKSSKRMGIHTEASHRFERGVDPHGLIFALDYAASLIEKLGVGKVAKGVLEVSSKAFPINEITLRLQKLNALIGVDFSKGEVEAILKRARFEIKSFENETFTILAPSYRIDLHQEIDLIEEVARLYGYDQIFEKKKATFYQGSKIPDTPIYTFDQEVRKILLREGLQELLTCDLISPSDASLIQADALPARSWIKLLNPGSMDQSVLRPSLFPGMLKVVKYNLDHGTPNLAGFEIGRTHFKMKESYLEPTMAAIVLSGKRAPYNPLTKPEDCDFFDLKGMLENLFSLLRINNFSFVKSSFHNFHPGRQAAIVVEGHECGAFGEVHPETLKKMDIAQKVFIAEFNLEDLIDKRTDLPKMTPLPTFPSSARDWTLTIDASIQVEKIFEAIKQAGSKYLADVSLLDVYQSEKLGSEWKNITLRFVYRDLTQTILQKNVEEEHARITEYVRKNIKVKEGL